MTLSYFTGEQHSENFEQIINLAEELGYSVRVYESKESNQFDFMQAVYRDTATIVDATIPDDLTLSTVYPLLTAHVNILDHILVFSEKQYEDGTQILPLNICPQRSMSWYDKELLGLDFLGWLGKQLEDLRDHQYYERIEIESVENLIDYKYPMERIMSDSLELHKPKKGFKKRVMMSYRNAYSHEVEIWRRNEENKGDIEVKILPPGSLCDDYEVLTPMRKWMIAGIIENHIRSVDEVWVYYTDDYANSWWTLVDVMMVAYINHDRAEEDKVKIKVYDAVKKRFMVGSENGYPAFLHILLTDFQHQMVARLLSNTSPNTYEDFYLASLCVRFLEPQYQEIASLILNTRPGKMDYTAPRTVRDLKKLAWKLFFTTKKKRKLLFEQLRPIIELSVPGNLPFEERDQMVNDLLAMYSDPRDIMAYTKDDVFKETFWNNISCQTDYFTPAYKDGAIDVDAFIDTPMRELTQFNDEILRPAVRDDKAIMLKGQRYYVREGKTRYFWVPTHNGVPSVEDASGIKIAQTYYWQPLVIIRYCKKDSSKAEFISSKLKELGITCVIDCAPKKCEYEGYINSQQSSFGNYKLVIYLLSADNADSIRTNKEIEYAIKIGKPLITIITDETPLPRQLQLWIGINYLGWNDERDIFEKIKQTVNYYLDDVPKTKFPCIRSEEEIDTEIKRLDMYQPQKNDCKIFISYRRETGEAIARNILLKLESLGYDNIFLDYTSIRNGSFNIQIIDSIYSCNDFLLILSSNAMDRCKEKGDWVAREIHTALINKKNIIPITTVQDFDWSSIQLPTKLNDIKNRDIHQYLGNEYFDACIDMLSKKLKTIPTNNASCTEKFIQSSQELFYYKITVDKKCRLIIDDKEIQELEASKITKIPLPKGKYIRKVVDFEKEENFKVDVLVMDGEEAEIIRLSN